MVFFNSVYPIVDELQKWQISGIYILDIFSGFMWYGEMCVHLCDPLDVLDLVDELQNGKSTAKLS